MENDGVKASQVQIIIILHLPTAIYNFLAFQTDLLKKLIFPYQLVSRIPSVIKHAQSYWHYNKFVRLYNCLLVEYINTKINSTNLHLA